MSIWELYRDWREHAWDAWRKQRRGEASTTAAARRFGFFALQRRWFLTDLPYLRSPNHFRHESGGWIHTLPKGHFSKLDWDAVRAEQSVAEDEKLYYGFVTKFPEVKVPDHHQRRRPGSPVYVDDKPLYRRLWVTEDRLILTRGEMLQPAEEAADENGMIEATDSTGEEAPIAKGVMQSMLLIGSSIYDRDRPYGEEELALNILADFYDEETAREWYQRFEQDVVSQLSYIELTPTFSCLDTEDAFDKYGEWFLTGAQLQNWLTARK